MARLETKGVVDAIRRKMIELNYHVFCGHKLDIVFRATNVRLSTFTTKCEEGCSPRNRTSIRKLIVILSILFLENSFRTIMVSAEVKLFRFVPLMYYVFVSNCIPSIVKEIRPSWGLLY